MALTQNSTLALTDLALRLFLSTIASRLHPSQREQFTSCMQLSATATAVAYHHHTVASSPQHTRQKRRANIQPLTPPTSPQALSTSTWAPSAPSALSPTTRVASELLLLRRLIHFSATLHPSLSHPPATQQQTHHMAFYAIILIQRMIRLSPSSEFVTKASASSLLMAGLMLAEAQLGDVQTSARVWSGLSACVVPEDGGIVGVQAVTTLSHAPAIAKRLALEALGFDSYVELKEYFEWFRCVNCQENHSHCNRMPTMAKTAATTSVPAVNGHANGSNGKVAAASKDKDGKRKKQRRKKQKGAKPSASAASEAARRAGNEDNDAEEDMVDDDIEIEYVPAPAPPQIESNEALADYGAVFARFNLPAEALSGSAANPATGGEGGLNADAMMAGAGMDAAVLAGANPATLMMMGYPGYAGYMPPAEGDGEEDEDEGAAATSKKKKRLAERLSVAQLKQLVTKPEVVEWVDITAADPKLLVHLKSYRNTVPVPMHWQQKRKYLQGKRGIEKPPFQLPDFIKATGIQELRENVKDKSDATNLKNKTRDRLQPKMGKLDIDYQKLHDAFFRWQTKPKLSSHGDLYFEGKEFETKLKLKKPGQLSDELRAALSMPPLAPPPWLVNMQRYGPPPSYPSLKVPGLNAPIPEGSQWGYHPGGWGKPPVDEYGRPLYGDVFGTVVVEIPTEHMAEVERKVWGELEVEEEEEEEEQGGDDGEEEEGEKEGEEDEKQDFPPEGLVTPSGMQSVPSGLETPDFIELRKERRDEGPKELYTVLPQRDNAVKGFMGSQHTYDVSSITAAASSSSAQPVSSDSAATKRRRAGVPLVIDRKTAVETALDPELLQTEGGLKDAVKRAYDGKVKETLEGNKGKGEDLSDMVAEHAGRQEAKRRRRDDDGKGRKKEEKKFKF
ncbi:Splicing factor 3B subunit 2 [Irineochytrium annulatum]|nr:Splicing factor 3B subunit 2 [Irineochytrium annulatum]